MSALRLVYAANVLVAGVVGLLSLLAPRSAAASVWQGTTYSDAASLRVVGAFWTAIALLSLTGVARPQALAPLLLVQLIYKALWLLVVALPALVAGRGESLPSGIAWFFVAWVAILPLVIPWGTVFRGS